MKDELRGTSLDLCYPPLYNHVYGLPLEVEDRRRHFLASLHHLLCQYEVEVACDYDGSILMEDGDGLFFTEGYEEGCSYFHQRLLSDKSRVYPFVGPMPESKNNNGPRMGIEPFMHNSVFKIED